jgi:hypothetical protein
MTFQQETAATARDLYINLLVRSLRVRNLMIWYKIDFELYAECQALASEINAA